MVCPCKWALWFDISSKRYTPGKLLSYTCTCCFLQRRKKAFSTVFKTPRKFVYITLLGLVVLDPNTMQPTNHAYNLHPIQCNHQLMAWQKACTFIQNLPYPVQYGYEEVEDMLFPCMAKQGVAAPELL